MAKAERSETSTLGRTGEGASPTGVATQPSANARLPTEIEAQGNSIPPPQFNLEESQELDIQFDKNAISHQSKQKKYPIRYHSRLGSDREIIALQKERMTNI